MTSLLLFRLAFLDVNQKYISHQLALAAQARAAAAEHEGNIAIKGVSKAERCDICHQTDQFDMETGFCQRCQQRTV